MERLQSDVKNGSIVVMGAICFGESKFPSEVLASEMPSTLSLSGDESDDAPNREINTKTDTHLAGSCILRGYHYWRFDTVLPDAAPTDQIRARCLDCGKEFWRRVRLARQERRPQAHHPAHPRIPIPALAHAPPPTPLPTTVPALVDATSISGSVLLDALCYMRIGTWQAFQTLAAAVNDSPTFAPELIRTLAALAHIDIELDEHHSRPIRWSISPTTLVPISDDKAVLCGWRSESVIERLQALVSGEGGIVSLKQTALGIPLIQIEELKSQALQEVADRLSKEVRHFVTVFSNPQRHILGSVPSISMVGRSLSKLTLPSRDLEFFDLGIARWKPITVASTAGAYRASVRGTTYLYVSAAELTDRIGRIGDPRTVKYLAALEVGASLVSYSETEQTLITPLGCELPGLLERVATLCSGRAPEKLNGRRQYCDVPKDIAHQIWERLRC
jgi:hypothetical protein